MMRSPNKPAPASATLGWQASSKSELNAISNSLVLASIAHEIPLAIIEAAAAPAA